MSTSTDFPVTDWLLSLPLYTPVAIGSNASPTVRAILTYVAIVDFYCPACKKFTPFQGVLSLETQNSMASELMAAKSFGVAAGFWTQKKFSKELSCTRANHKTIFHFQIEDGHLLKVGQYPSIADINFGEVLEFASALGEQRTHELNKAIELAGNGAGLGAYIYLKKIFESLLEDAHQIALSNKAWDEAGYLAANISNKVKILAPHLPSFILEHPEHYAMLDHGLDELTDAICLEQFNALKTAVLVITDERLAQLTRDLRVSQASESLESATQPS
ncbi:MAG: hypothetical protein ACXW1P_02415 [Methylophilaceae bacterium]